MPLHALALPVGAQDRQVASRVLVDFYRFEQRLEVAGAEALRGGQRYLDVVPGSSRPQHLQSWLCGGTRPR